MFQEIELCNSDIKKIYYIFSEENHTYISGDGTLHFFSHSSKNNKIHPEKIYTSGDKTPKKISYIFSKGSFSYYLGKQTPETETLEKFLIFQE